MPCCNPYARNSGFSTDPGVAACCFPVAARSLPVFQSNSRPDAFAERRGSVRCCTDDLSCDRDTSRCRLSGNASRVAAARPPTRNTAGACSKAGRCKKQATSTRLQAASERAKIISLSSIRLQPLGGPHEPSGNQGGLIHAIRTSCVRLTSSSHPHVESCHSHQCGATCTDCSIRRTAGLSGCAARTA